MVLVIVVMCGASDSVGCGDISVSDSSGCGDVMLVIMGVVVRWWLW